MGLKIKGRLIILSGPSCVGKSPLTKALAKFNPELWKTLKPLVLYNSRSPRPGELDGKDYHFRTREEIEKLKPDDNFIVMEVRGDLQALNVRELSDELKSENIFFEGNPFVGKILLTHLSLENIDKLSVFMSPLSKSEIRYLNETGSSLSLRDIITDVMRRKLLRRTKKQKNELSLKDLENIEKRASSAYNEMTDAHLFQHVIPNHDGEDSENWDAFYYPLGDALLSLNTFVSLLNNEKHTAAEKWGKDLIK